MADIKAFLAKIKEAVFGEEVRGSIYDALRVINEESEAAKISAAESAGSAEKALNDTRNAIEDTNTAITGANTAAAEAREAAEEAREYILGDVSEKTVTFQQAAQRANIQSGDSLAVAFGKLAKFCADLKPYVFVDPVNNLLSDDQSLPLAAPMGKQLATNIGNLGDLTTTEKSSVVAAINEQNTNMLVTGAFSGSWLPGFMINGMGFTIIIPKHSKKHTLTISSARIFTPEGGWVDTAISTIADMPNCWRVILKSDASMKLTSGYAYIADLAGQIK